MVISYSMSYRETLPNIISSLTVCNQQHLGMLQVLSLKEIAEWLGISPFELSLQLLSLLTTSILIPMKLEHDVTLSWWTVFTPIWITDGMWIYFRLIIYLRLHFHYTSRRHRGILKFFWIITFTALLISFEMLLCQHLEHSKYTLTTVFIPLFIVLGLLLIRSCIYPKISGNHDATAANRRPNDHGTGTLGDRMSNIHL